MRQNEETFVPRATKQVSTTSASVRAPPPPSPPPPFAACWANPTAVRHSPGSSERSAGGKPAQRFSSAIAAASACGTCQVATAACSCVADSSSSFCLEPCQIWKIVVVATASKPRTRPGALSCTCVLSTPDISGRKTILRRGRKAQRTQACEFVSLSGCENGDNSCARSNRAEGVSSGARVGMQECALASRGSCTRPRRRLGRV
mmetsp:Transcript_40538/g.134145  ORF Transcript_40538/g.134145 Transcript_40538/m.134145 type:complete len:204 (+) Transcript_40538:633-1244(+)